MLILTAGDLARALDLDELVGAVAASSVARVNGEVTIPGHTFLDAGRRRGSLRVTSGYRSGAGQLTTRLATCFAGDSPFAAPRAHALVLAFDARTGRPLALMDGEMLGVLHSAAAARLATRLLAVEHASVAAVLGAGPPARAQAHALLRERPIRELRIADRDAAAARRLARRVASETDAAIVVAHSYEHALAGAHVVSVAATAEEAIVRREWLSDGVHVNAVAALPRGPEIDPAALSDALLFEEHEDGGTTLGHLILDPARGRSDPAQLTLYRSSGLVTHDDAAAELALAAARRDALGTYVDL